MTDRFEWAFGSKAGILLAHVSEYEPERGLYELSKNAEEAGARKIQIEFDYDGRKIVITDDGDGMGVDELNRMSQNIGRSSKDPKHYGVGMMSFFRIGTSIVIFSKRKQDRMPSVVSCAIKNDTIVSETGGPREAEDSDMTEHSIQTGRLMHGSKHGTVMIVEGVGRNKASRYDFTFDMREVFERKRFEAYFRREAEYKLATYSYFIKYGSDKPRKLTPKLGSGKHIKARFPGKKFPCLSAKGEPINVFCIDSDTYELRVDLDLWASASQRGAVHVSEDKQNVLEMKDAMRHCKSLSYTSSIFLGHSLAKYLHGLVDVHVKPLNGAPEKSIWSGSRMQLNMSGPFGAAFANMLNHIDVEFLRDTVEAYVSDKLNMKDERRSREIQQDMEAMVKGHPEYFESLVSTQSVDEVRQYKVKCRGCGLSATPSRGLPPSEQMSNDCIYYMPEAQTYYCGNCGTTWKRVTRPAPAGEPRRNPTYRQPRPGTGTERRRRHGFGFTFSVRPFESKDGRRTRVDGTTVEINSIHDSYKAMSAVKGPVGGRLLKVYERQQALQAIVEHEADNLTRDQIISKLRDGDTLVLTWYNSEKPQAAPADIVSGAPSDGKRAAAGASVVPQPTAADLKAAWEGR